MSARPQRPSRGEQGTFLFGVHPVAEALEADRRRIERILVDRQARGSRIGRILKQARLAGVPVSYLPRSVLARKAGAKAVHQGIAAEVTEFEYADPGEVLDAAKAVPAALLLALDRVEDPRNLGAAARSAAAAGVDGILLAMDATVGVTPAARKTSAGTLERIPVARDPNLVRTLQGLQESGFGVVGLDPGSQTPWDRFDWSGPIVVVAGGEERGPRNKVLQACNHRVAIPLAEGVESLNVSVAVGVALFEAVRQRRQLER
jgi:23S rRNA (guanosine2251-2'-O)-methyltransferase